MGTLVYSPDIEVMIESELHGIINVSDDIVSGNMSLNQNRPHTLSLQLDNPRRKYDGAFMPNDRIVVRLKRLSFLQVFAGYLESVPFASVWPRAVSLTASCTLKRLMYLLYDPGTQAMMDLLNEFAIAPDGTSDDGNLTARAKAVLTNVAQIREENIHIGALPTDWWSTVSELYAQVSPFFDASVVDFVTGTTGGQTTVDGAFINNDVNDPSIMGPPSVNVTQMAAWYRSKGKTDPPFAPIEQICHWFIAHGMSEGVRGDLAFVHSCIETGWFTNGDSRQRNNFTGIGHYDNAPAGFTFDTPSQGVLAAIQLYKKYALGNDVAMTNPDVSPDGPGGGHQTYSALAAVWATDPGLGPLGISLFQNLLASAGTTMAGLDPNTTTNGSTTTQTAVPPTRDPDAGPRTPTTTQTTVPPTRDPDAGAAPVGNEFVFPLPPEYQGTYGDNFGEDRSSNRPADAVDKTHDGIDIMCPAGTALFAVRSGTIAQASNDISSRAGRRITLVDSENNHFKYFHLQTISVNQGDTVRAGQQIGTAGGSGKGSNTGYSPHLHIEWRPDGGEEQNIFPLLTGGTMPSGGTSGSLISGQFQIYDPGEAARQESTALAGIRRLMNDGGNNVHGLVQELFGAAMRSYCSAPNGDIIAWFPDYFDNYGTAGKAVIEDIELIDFTINWSDTGMVTHQFVTGTYEGLHQESNPNDLTYRFNTHGIASIDFPQILEALFGSDAGFWTNPDAIYQRFGARPNFDGITALIRDPGSGSSGEFFYAVHQFMFNWAAMFSASVQVSFMPELWPGMLMQIPSQGLQVYVTQVNHSWNMQTGFTTSAQVIAPSDLDGSFMGLPQAQALAAAGSGGD